MRIKKLSLFFLLIMSLLTGLTACTSSGNTSNLSANNLEESLYHSEYESENINMYIQNDTITSDTKEIILTYENTSEFEYNYDEKLILEVNLDNTWYTIPIDSDSLFKDSKSFILLANHNFKDEFNISNYIDKLIPGHYRVVKEFSNKNEEVYQIAEFFIE